MIRNRLTSRKGRATIYRAVSACVSKEKAESERRRSGKKKHTKIKRLR